MPTYEYVCPAGHEFEKFQKMSARPSAKCPVCKRSAVRRISGGAGLVFKGSGFYITDYGKDGKGPRKPPVESSSDSKPESKPGTGDKGSSSSGTPKPDTKAAPKKAAG